MNNTIIAIFITALIFPSCNNEPTQQAAQKAQAIDSVMKAVGDQPKDIVPQDIPTGDNSANALDWPGTYKGIVPCADCAGVETTITLEKELLYLMTIKYLGKRNSKLYETKGDFTWNKEGSKIVLKGVENTPDQYLVGENKLLQLDLQGNRIKGKNAQKYQLIKLSN